MPTTTGISVRLHSTWTTSALVRSPGSAATSTASGRIVPAATSAWATREHTSTSTWRWVSSETSSPTAPRSGSATISRKRGRQLSATWDTTAELGRNTVSPVLSEAAGDVGLCAPVGGVGEGAVGVVELDETAVAHLLFVDLGGEERGVVADPGCLLHVVRDDDDGVGLGQLAHEVLDPAGGDLFER